MTADESPAEPPRPAKATSPAEFAAALRALRTWSGLTYRQLEGNAATYRDTLPASTIATTLGRATLPKERFVDAFARACGLGDDDVRQWLEARRRVAMADPATQPDEEPTPTAPRWRRVVAAGCAGVVIGAAGALGADALFGADGPGSGSVSAMPVAGLDMRAVGSWARIHPIRTPSMCVTEGIDRTERYKSAVAAQRPCVTELPRTYLEPVDKNVVRLQWHHPEFGIGCLTVMIDGPGENLLEPRNDCADDPAQMFRLERFNAHFRIRPAVTDGCLGLRDQGTEEGAEIAQGPCTGAEDQEFQIELINPPT